MAQSVSQASLAGTAEVWLAKKVLRSSDNHARAVLSRPHKRAAVKQDSCNSCGKQDLAEVLGSSRLQ